MTTAIHSHPTYYRLPPRGQRCPFGLSKDTIRRLAAAGRIKLSKVGRNTLVDYASMRAYVESCTITPQSGAKNASATC